MSAFSKVLKRAGNAVADALPQFGSIKVDNAANPTSAYSMMRRKQNSAGPAKAFRLPSNPPVSKLVSQKSIGNK